MNQLLRSIFSNPNSPGVVETPQLPKDIWIHIFDYLPLIDQGKLSRTCKCIKKAVDYTFILRAKRFGFFYVQTKEEAVAVIRNLFTFIHYIQPSSFFKQYQINPELTCEEKLWKIAKLPKKKFIPFYNNIYDLKKIGYLDLFLSKHLKITASKIRNEALQNILNFSLYKRARSGYTITKLLLEYGGDPAYQTPRAWGGGTVLHRAVLSNSVRTVSLLLSHKINSNIKSLDKNNSPLESAIEIGNVSIVKLLLEYGSDSNFYNGRPLHLAVRTGQEKITRMLFKYKADPNIPLKGQSTLENSLGFPALTTLLLKNGAKDRNLLHKAVLKGKIETVRLLVELGFEVNCRNDKGQTPLYLAALEGSVEMLNFLLENAADPKIETHGARFTPLMASASRGVTFMASLLNKGANIKCQSRNGLNCLHIAVDKQRMEVVDFLLLKDLDVNSKTHDKRTPLWFAIKRALKAEKKNLEMIRLLLKKGADPDQPTKNGNRALHLAAEGNCPELFRIFLDSGCQINAKNDRGQTPLHIAAKKSQDGLIEPLLANGADPNTKDHAKKTPLSYAVSVGNEPIIEELLSHEADPNIPLEIDFENNYIVESLLLHGRVFQRDELRKISLELLLKHGLLDDT